MKAALALPLALLLTMTACERLQQTIEDTARDDDKDAAPTDLPPEESNGATDEEKVMRKLALYIACIDRSRSRIQSSWNRYVEDIDPGTGVPRRKSGQPFLQPIDKELDPCHEAVDRGPKLDPPLPEIEAAMGAYQEASTEFAGHTRALHAYYENKGYESDDWATAKRIAPEIASTYETWSAASRQLGEAVSRKREQVERDMLALIEAREGQSLRWHANNVAILAKAFRSCIEQADAAIETCQDSFDTLRGAHQGFLGHHDAHADEAAKVFWMLAYQTTAAEYVEEAGTLMRTRAKIKPKARQDAIDALVRLHDDLASDHANLRFDFP